MQYFNIKCKELNSELYTSKPDECSFIIGMTYCMSQILISYQDEGETLSVALQWQHREIYTGKKTDNPYLKAEQ